VDSVHPSPKGIPLRIYGIQWSGLPVLHNRQDLVGYGTEGGGGDLYAVEFLKMVRNITIAHSKGIEGDYLLIKHLTEIGSGAS